MKTPEERPDEPKRLAASDRFIPGIYIGNNPEETEALPGLIFRPEMTAMKGLEKFIHAWTVIMEESPEYEDRILDFLVRLVRISNIARERFPGAEPLSGQNGVNEAEENS
ncbi:MAG: hypothetical protein ACP5D1_11355 [Bacteroidales bacterium]